MMDGMMDDEEFEEWHDRMLACPFRIEGGGTIHQHRSMTGEELTGWFKREIEKCPHCSGYHYAAGELDMPLPRGGGPVEEAMMAENEMTREKLLLVTLAVSALNETGCDHDKAKKLLTDAAKHIDALLEAAARTGKPTA
jgi:hypothetical protein